MQANIDWKERAARLFCFALLAVAAYLAVKYFLTVIILSASVILISYGVSRLSEKLCRATHVPAGVWACLVLTLGLCCVGAALFYAMRELIGQLSSVAKSFGEGAPFEWHRLIYALGEMPVIGKLIYDSGEYATAEVVPVLSRMLEHLSGVLSAFVSRALKATPSALMSGVVALMSPYYMSLNFEGACDFVKRLFSSRTANRLSRIERTALTVGVRFIRAHAVLFLITFCEVFVGLLIIRPQYALLGALGIAVVDMLPILGSGTVLIPWSLICFVGHDLFSGVALLILYVTVSVVRRIAEPRVIGQSIGLHPFGALICMYIGYRMFGVLGMFASPAAVAVVMACVQNKENGVQ
jgi:sporulation integral membrane protein YtvI